MLPKIGDKAPTFNLETDNGDHISLDKLSGKKVVLFFYPKDDTPGCTKESCEFRDLETEFRAKNACVLGISADDSESHRAFKGKFSLNYPLLVDKDHQLSEQLGVWREQEWQGKKSWGIARTTFVINEQGKFERIYEKVNPVGHADKVLSELS